MVNDKGKIATLLLIILTTVFLLLSGASLYLFQNERARNLALQQELENATDKYKRAESELEGAKKKISTHELQLKEAQNRAETLNAELEQAKIDKQDAFDSLERLKRDLDQQKESRLDIEKKFLQAQADIKKTQEQVKNLEAEKNALLTKIKDLEAKSQGVELGKIVVTPESIGGMPVEIESSIQPEETNKINEGIQASGAAGALEGKILVVNKDYDFAVIDLGGKNGINIGDVFSVSRDNKYIGDIKVEKVHDDMAAAGFISEGIKDKVNEGDKVAQKVK